MLLLLLPATAPAAGPFDAPPLAPAVPPAALLSASAPPRALPAVPSHAAAALLPAPPPPFDAAAISSYRCPPLRPACVSRSCVCAVLGRAPLTRVELVPPMLPCWCPRLCCVCLFEVTQSVVRLACDGLHAFPSAFARDACLARPSPSPIEGEARRGAVLVRCLCPPFGSIMSTHYPSALPFGYSTTTGTCYSRL